MSNIMSWERVNIGQYLKLLSGYPFPSDSFSNSEGFPLIRIRDILDSKVETYFQGPYLSIYIVREGDILIGMDGDFHVAKWKSRDALLNQRVLKVDSSDTQKIDSNFIYYWLQPYVKKVNDVTAATTVKHLSLKDLLKAEGQIPKVSIQKKIATVLQTIDQAIESTEALIKKYQKIKTGLMHDVFTRGISFDGKLRPSKEQAPELYKETAIGWIPKDWKARKLKEILSDSGGYLQTGPFGSQLHAHEYTLEGVPVVMPQDINDGKIGTEDIARIPESRAATLQKHRMKLGDVIIARRGDLSRAATIYDNQKNIVCGTGCFLLRLGNSNLDARFFSKIYRYDLIQRQVVGLAVGTTMPSLNNEIMGKLIFPDMTVEEQNRISDRLEIVEAKITGLSSHLSKLLKQKSGLMHDLLTGKVPVKIDETEVTNV